MKSRIPNTTQLLTVIFLIAFFSFESCDMEEITPEIYLEGKPILGAAWFHKLQLYGSGDLLPKISSDGTKLLYTGSPSLGNRGLWVMDIATQSKTLITTDGFNADWAPDGQSIYFNGYDLQIYEAKLDGSELLQLTSGEGQNLFPACSPDGNHIIYANTYFKDGGIYIINTKGTYKKKILSNLTYYPAWMPDQKSFFLANGNTYDTLGQVVKELNFKLKYGPGNASVSPTDSRIVISASSGIYVVNPDGSGLKRILPNHLYNPSHQGPVKLWAQNASWHPDGKHIIYEHLAFTRTKQTDSYGLFVEGTMAFYKVNVDSAIMVSNLQLY